jgi:hypothetical protein
LSDEGAADLAALPHMAACGRTARTHFFTTKNREGAMADVSGANITIFMKGISFPANKQQVIDHAKKNGADQDTLKALNLLNDSWQFQSMADLMQKFGEARSKAA